MDDFRDELFADDEEDQFGDFDDFVDDDTSSGQVIGGDDDFADTGRSGGGGQFLGMSSMERAFLSVMLFLNVLVLGIGLLLAFGRFGF